VTRITKVCGTTRFVLCTADSGVLRRALMPALNTDQRLYLSELCGSAGRSAAKGRSPPA